LQEENSVVSADVVSDIAPITSDMLNDIDEDEDEDEDEEEEEEEENQEEEDGRSPGREMNWDEAVHEQEEGDFEEDEDEDDDLSLEAPFPEGFEVSWERRGAHHLDSDSETEAADNLVASDGTPLDPAFWVQERRFQQGRRRQCLTFCTTKYLKAHLLDFALFFLCSQLPRISKADIVQLGRRGRRGYCRRNEESFGGIRFGHYCADRDELRQTQEHLVLITYCPSFTAA
jgi:hypothetical protein